MTARKLPPFGKRYLADPPAAGLCVAIGPDAWRYAKQKPFQVLVLPPENEPQDFRWPSHPGGAVVFEVGEFNDDRLEAMATELLKSGCPFVCAIREALVHVKDADPRHFFYPENVRVCA